MSRRDGSDTNILQKKLNRVNDVKNGRNIIILILKVLYSLSHLLFKMTEIPNFMIFFPGKNYD